MYRTYFPHSASPLEGCPYGRYLEDARPPAVNWGKLDLSNFIFKGRKHEVLEIIYFWSEIQNIGAKAVLRINDILLWIRIRGSMPLLMDPDPDPSIFIIDLQDANKNLI